MLLNIGYELAFEIAKGVIRGEFEHIIDCWLHVALSMPVLTRPVALAFAELVGIVRTWSTISTASHNPDIRSCGGYN